VPIASAELAEAGEEATSGAVSRVSSSVPGDVIPLPDARAEVASTPIAPTQTTQAEAAPTQDAVARDVAARKTSAGAASKEVAPTKAAATSAAATQAAQTQVPPSHLVPKKSVAIRALKPETIYKPTVVLSRAHELTCLVNVGDTLPNLELTKLTGEQVALDELRGDQLTVVVFWTNRFAFAREQFGRLASEVALPYRHLGVKVVAVNVGDPVEQIELDDVTKNEVVCVHDSDGSAIAKVATTKLPRTYLVDAEGQILWFDLEYSRTTRRQLKNAIFYHSRKKDSAN
jgi:peroxiredoxin